MVTEIFVEEKKERVVRTALGVFTTVIVIVLSYFIWRYVAITVEKLRGEAYESMMEGVLKEVEDKSNYIEDSLHSLRGAMLVGQINSKTWNDYLSSIKIEDKYSGIFSFALVDIVAKANVQEYVANVRVADRDQQYKSFYVFPKTDNAEVYPIRYLYTFDSDISLLIGYDVGSSVAVTAGVVAAARDNKASLSDLTYLKLLIPSSQKTGYVVALPLFSDVKVLNLAIEQRNKKLIGFVGVWVSNENLFSGTLGEGEDGELFPNYEVYEGNALIYKKGTRPGDGHYTKDLKILNKSFRVVFSSPVGFKLGYLQENLPTFTFLGLLLVAIMWYVTLISLLTSRRKAVNLASSATKDLVKFRQAVEGVSDHVIITDQQGVLIYANEAASRITGYPLEEMIGSRPSLWGKQMSEDYYNKMWHRIKVLKKPYYGELKNKRKTGEIYDAEVSISPILDGNGEIIYFVGIERDVTKARSIDRIKTEFISLASHQLRTPLSAVKWFSRMLLDGDAGDLSGSQREYVEKINISNEKEIQIVNSLLNISRVESGKISMIPKPTDMKHLVETVIADVTGSSNRKVRKIELEVIGDIPKINIDPGLIRHVYMNSLMNAVSYTNEGGKIKITLERKGKYLLSTVADNGIGIPRDDQKRIFERFFRGTNAMKRETEGSGLGLYLAKVIIESSRGKIWFKSEEGKGTSLYFTIPIAEIKTKEDQVILKK